MKKILSLLTLSTLILSACTTPANVNNEDTNIKIKFKAVADNKEIACGQTYENIGTSKSKVSVTDFRFYIHKVTLTDDKGKDVELKLTQDKKWQNGETALLDFEDKSGDCSSGNQDVNKEVVGTIAKGNYKTLKFTLGIPFNKNHQDPTKAESPFNLTSMFWTWNAGYKFTRIDLKTTGLPQGYFIHLGSTGCMAGMETKHEATETHGEMVPDKEKAPTMCKNPNRAEIVLENFDVNKNTVVADLSSLLGNSDVDKNTDKTAAGCMSGTDDPECKEVMNNFGLKFGDSESKGQKFFRAE